MKTVIKEYAGMVIAMVITCLLLGLLGSLLFQQDGVLSRFIEIVLEGGI